MKWRRVDPYHQRSECGRFSVSRLKTPNAIWYIAWRWPELELGATCLPIVRTDEGVPVLPNDAERSEAIGAMKELCEGAASDESHEGDAA